MNGSIAFFDFDGTITTHDTLLEFIKFSKGKGRFYLGFLLNSPWLVAYKLKIIPNQAAKERILRFFFRKTAVATFEQICRSFSTDVLPALLRPKAIAEIRMLQDKGFTVVVVSASPQDWIRLWADSCSLQLIATRLEIKDQALTGRIAGQNCFGEEKVRRIKEQYKLDDYSQVYAYGDSGGDRPMLKLAGKVFYKPFR